MKKSRFMKPNQIKDRIKRTESDGECVSTVSLRARKQNIIEAKRLA